MNGVGLDESHFPVNWAKQRTWSMPKIGRQRRTLYVPGSKAWTVRYDRDRQPPVKKGFYYSPEMAADFVYMFPIGRLLEAGENRIEIGNVSGKYALQLFSCERKGKMGIANVRLARVTDTTAEVAWDPGLARYEIGYRPAGSATWQTVSNVLDWENPYTVILLKPGTSYEFRVRGFAGPAADLEGKVVTPPPVESAVSGSARLRSASSLLSVWPMVLAALVGTATAGEARRVAVLKDPHSHEVAEFGETQNWQGGAWRPAKRSCIKIRPAKPSATARFLTVLYPLRPNESLPDIKGVAGSQADLCGVKVLTGQETDIVAFAPGGKGIAVEGLRTDGTKCMARRDKEGSLRRFAVHDATSLEVGGVRVFSSDRKAAAAALMEPTRTTVVLSLGSDARVALRVQARPRSVALDGAELERLEYLPPACELSLSVPKGTHTLLVER